MKKANFTTSPFRIVGVAKHLALALPIMIALFFSQSSFAQSLACTNLVNVSISGAGDPGVANGSIAAAAQNDPNCSATITPIMVSAGPAPVGAFVEVLNANGTARATPIVNRFDVGMTLTYRLRLPGGQMCWGTLNIEDKDAPVLRCKDRAIESCQVPTPGVNQIPGGNAWIGTAVAVTATTQFGFSSIDLNAVDCSSAYSITYNDVVTPSDVCAPTRTLVRVYTATDLMGRFRTCSQTIVITRPVLASVQFPADVTVDCASASAGATAPSAGGAGVPFLVGPPRLNLFPDPAGCNFRTTFKDDTLVICAGSRKILRTWKVCDLCNPSVVRDDLQVIVIRDQTGPVITFPMQMVDIIGMGGNCTSDDFLAIPSFSDNCSGVVAASATVTGGGSVVAINALQGLFRLVGAPAGPHTVIYSATDGCGNVSTATRSIEVRDNKVPTAICVEKTVVSLTSDGTAKVFAQTFDKGSYDNCGILKYRVRRMTPVCGGPLDGRDGTTFGDWVPFRCCEVGQTVMVSMEVEDWSGNKNSCMVEITVQDKTAPSIYCPKDFTVFCDGCNDLSEQGLRALNTPFGYVRTRAIDIRNGDIFEKDAYDADLDCNYNECNKVGVITDGLATDECLRDIQLQVQIDKKCGWDVVAGQPEITTIRRTFTARDLAGNTSTCRQTITVLPRSNFAVQFPLDVTITTCPTDPGATGTPTFTDVDCEVLATEFEDERFNVIGTDACYKIIRTWKVINWCIFNPLGPRDPGRNEIQAQRDFDCDGTLEANVYRDGGFMTPNGPATNPSMSGNSNGYFQYRQVIKVQDNVAPTFTDTTTYVEVCDFTNNDPSLYGSVCEAPASLSVSATDACSPNAITYSWQIDRDNNGTIDFQGTGNSINAELPYGRHKVTFTAMDGCGNMSSKTIIVLVKDCKKPTIVCYAGLSINLMNTTPPMVSLPVNHFIQYTNDNCGIVSDFRIRRATAFPPTGPSNLGPPAVGSTSLNFTCADITAPVPVEVWGVDPAGNWDYCVTFLSVEDNMAICTGSPRVAISGALTSETGTGVANANVSVNTAASILSSNSGTFRIGGLTPGGDYTVTASKNTDWTQGVNTRDLSLIQQHILGTKTLNSNFKVIAADANKDGNVRASDISELRKLILGLTSSIPGNTSYRFIDPITGLEVINFNNLTANAIADFTAVKVGDVDNTSWNVNGLSDRSGDLNIDADNQTMVSGNEYTVSLKANDFTSVEGFQFTLNLDPAKVEILGVTPGQLSDLSAANFGVFANEGVVTTSWNSKSSTSVENGNVLFSVRVKANANTELSEIATITSTKTEAVAFKGGSDKGVTLNVGGKTVGTGFELYQNVPNPFAGNTAINFTMPEAGAATLKVFDIQGKVLYTVAGEYAKGGNVITLSKTDIAASGVLYYQLESNFGTATKKMIIIE
jgi:hypothetical protein